MEFGGDGFGFARLDSLWHSWVIGKNMEKRSFRERLAQFGKHLYIHTWYIICAYNHVQQILKPFLFRTFPPVIIWSKECPYSWKKGLQDARDPSFSTTLVPPLHQKTTSSYIIYPYQMHDSMIPAATSHTRVYSHYIPMIVSCLSLQNHIDPIEIHKIRVTSLENP